MKTIEFTIPGEAIPQGSKTIAKSGNKVWLREANPRLKGWRETVATHTPALLWDTPVMLDIVFGLKRGKTVTREWPSVKPDLDKLLRAVNDGMTGRLFTDDSRVIAVSMSKQYMDNPETVVRAWKV